MKNYNVNGKVIDITLDNDKIVKVSTEYVNNMVKNLGISEEEAIITWLEDEGYMENEEQNELDNIAKANKPKIKATTEKPKKKTPKERTQKPNPTKEKIIQNIAEMLENMQVDNLNIENKAKLITFTLDGHDFKLDLVQKRPPKTEK